MRVLIVLAAAAVLLGGCARALREYEVGELEEERVQQALKAVAAGIERRDPDLCVSRFAADFLDPAFDAGAQAATASPDGVVVSIWTPGAPVSPMDRAAFRAHFDRYTAGWKVVSRALAKIRRIDLDEDNLHATGRFFIDVYGISAGGEGREDFLFVETELEKRSGDWVITRLRFDRPTYASWGKRSQFRDVSREANAMWPHEAHPDARGFLPIPEQTADCGMACGDYDGDGNYDVYLCNGRRNTLLRNRGDGTFEDVTERAGLAGETGETRGALIVDLDGDGDREIYVSNNRTPNVLYRNNGDGTFTDVTAGSGLEFTSYCTSASAADYDRDGDLDIFQCVYGNYYDDFPIPPVYNAPPDRLYRNLGNLKFENVAEEAGVDDTGWTLAATWGDPNNDGWPDLLLANDFGDKCLFINDQEGGFDDVAGDVGLMDRNFGMAAAFGDIDNDGDFDIYFSNMYSNTNWIFNRPELLPLPWFLAWLRNAILGTMDEMTRGNSLFLSNGDGSWTNISEAAGVTYGQWAWGSEFLDFDADGDLDIYCVNGFISGLDSEDL